MGLGNATALNMAQNIVIIDVYQVISWTSSKDGLVIELGSRCAMKVDLE